MGRNGVAAGGPLSTAALMEPGTDPGGATSGFERTSAVIGDNAGFGGGSALAVISWTHVGARFLCVTCNENGIAYPLAPSQRVHDSSWCRKQRDLKVESAA
ncbi:unnamed protein product, partial [Iphiclides podalirius]